MATASVCTGCVANSAAVTKEKTVGLSEASPAARGLGKAIAEHAKYARAVVAAWRARLAE